MKQFTFLVLIMLSCMIRPSQAQSSSPSTKGEIRGRIYDSKTKNPLDFVSITISNSRDKIVAQVLSDDNGLYVVKQLDPDEYTIKVTNLGYLNFVTREKVTADDITFMEIAMKFNGRERIICCMTTCCFSRRPLENKVEDKSFWVKEQMQYQQERNLFFNCAIQHKSRVIEQELKESAVKLFNEVKSFPTTTNSVINIESMYDGEKELMIHSLSGSEMYHGTIVHHLQLEVSAFPPGLYVIMIIDKKYDEKNYTKFIVAQ